MGNCEAAKIERNIYENQVVASIEKPLIDK